MKTKTKRMLDNWADWFVIIGAVTWGTVAWFDFNLVAMLGEWTVDMVSTVAYSLVGVSGIWKLINKFK